ncbi:MAG: DUF1850 domain-containing protein [Tissierellaceae bacterium]|nr:DUF1850 domain-containing protein [Tissierellaceae bacterium]
MKKQVLNNSNDIDKGIEVKFNTLSIKKISIFLLLLVIFLTFIPVKVLLATNYKTNYYIKSWRIKDNDTFLIEHTHSVQLTTVSEKYLVSGQDIILIESIFHSFGAGLPATTPYKFELVNGGFRIYDINEKMENLVYRAGAVKANHRLIYNDKQYDFLNFTEPRTGVKFIVDRMPYILFKIREGIN